MPCHIEEGALLFQRRKDYFENNLEVSTTPLEDIIIKKF